MPRVSEAHIQARRRQITQAAFTCFAKQGIHRTTMQDIFREAGLSPGSVYTYFTGKDEIVRAIADDAFGRVAEELVPEESLVEVVDGLMRVFDYMNERGTDGSAVRMSIQLWAESLREPHMLGLMHRVLDLERERIAGAARRAQRRGELAADIDPEALGRAHDGPPARPDAPAGLVPGDGRRGLPPGGA